MSSFSGPANGLQQWSGPTHVTRNPTPAPGVAPCPTRALRLARAPGLPPPRFPLQRPKVPGSAALCSSGLRANWACSLSAPVFQACVCPVSWCRALSFPVAHLGGLTGLSSPLTFAASEHSVPRGRMAPGARACDLPEALPKDARGSQGQCRRRGRFEQGPGAGREPFGGPDVPRLALMRNADLDLLF